MNMSRISVLMTAVASLALIGCASTSGGEGGAKPEDVSNIATPASGDAKPGKIECNTGPLLNEMETLQVEIANSEDRHAAVLARRPALEMIALKAGNPKPDYEFYNVLACRTTEVMARALLVELPPGPGEADPLLAADKAVSDVTELCKSPQANQTQCSAVQDYFGAVIFARRAVSQLEFMTPAGAAAQPVDFVKVKELTEGLETHVDESWGAALTRAAANAAAPKIEGQDFPVSRRTLEDSFISLTCRTSFAVDTLVRSADSQGESYGNEGARLVASLSRGSGMGASAGCDSPDKSATSQMFCHNRVVAEKCENPDANPGGQG